MGSAHARVTRRRGGIGGAVLTLAGVLAAACGRGPTAADPLPGIGGVEPPSVAPSGGAPGPTAPRGGPGVGPDTSAITTEVAGAPLLTLVDDAAIPDAEVRTRLAALRTQPWAAAVRVARLVPGADTLLVLGRAVAFDVNARRRLVYAGERRTVNPTGSVSWYGVLQGGRFGQTNLVLTVLGVTGTLRVLEPHATYYVEPVGAGYQAITYIDHTRVPDP